jgi:D-3-phosphoglycerate dehydrogenase
MTEPFEIALTADFLRPDGAPAYADMGLELLEQAGRRVRHRYLESHEPEIPPEQVAGLDAVLCLTPRVTRNTLRDASRLKVIARFGVGYDSVDVPACTEADVAVTITVGAVNHSVAESIVTFMLALNHQLFAKDRLVREHRWPERSLYMGSELRGKVAGIVGLGGIGKQTLRLLSSFGMEPAVAFDPYLDAASMATVGAKKVDLPTLMRTADYVIVTCPLNEETRHLIGAAELAMMKPTAYLVNTARGGIVNEAALERALIDQTIAGAALDVFEREPTGADLPFSRLENVILAPHSIAVTRELVRDVGRMACRQILDVAAGQKPEGLLNWEVWERPGFRRKLGLS